MEKHPEHEGKRKCNRNEKSLPRTGHTGQAVPTAETGRRYTKGDCLYRPPSNRHPPARTIVLGQAGSAGMLPLLLGSQNLGCGKCSGCFGIVLVILSGKSPAAPFAAAAAVVMNLVRF